MDSSEYLLLVHNFPNFSSWIAPAITTEFQNFLSGSGSYSDILKNNTLVYAHSTLIT